MGPDAQTVGLYVSVPFCRAKCTFCNFASGVGSAEAIDRYVGLLCREIAGAHSAVYERGANLPRIADSVYFGGGTPSLLEPVQLQTLFGALRSEFDIAPDAEMTLEAAPGQMADALLETALTCGVNRVSLGVQSFVDRESQAVGRSHTAESCLQAFEHLRRAGIRNIGADLIAGLPYQTEESWEQSLEFAAAAGLQHVSVYMLEVDEDSRLGREVLGGGARLHAPAVPSDELTAALYERACERLSEAGFAQYEISNFAQEHRRSRHNLKYWTRQSYLGFGLDAHSMLLSRDGHALRWANPDEFSAYDGTSGAQKAEQGSTRDTFEETVFLGLRLVEGLSLSSLQPFPRLWIEEFSDAAKRLASEGLMHRCRDTWQLTGRGRLVSSNVFGELLAGVAV